MANEILRFRQGSRSNLPQNITAGELLFATYEDANSGITEAKVYLDMLNNERITLSNDADRARSLYSGATATNTLDGAWVAEIEGVVTLYDGLTISLRIERGPNSVYNTLELILPDNSTTGPKVVWNSYGVRLTTQCNIYDELLLVYRTHAGSYSPPTTIGDTPQTLTPGVNYTDGWMIINHGSKVGQVATIGNRDSLIIADDSDNQNLKRSSITFDGTSTNKALTQAGTWEEFNNYVLPVATHSILGGLKPFVYHSAAATGVNPTQVSTSAQMNLITTTEGRYYAVESDVAGRAFVNVPWINTTYTFASGDSNGTFKVTSGGNSQNVAITGLGSAAYENSEEFAPAAHSHSGTYTPQGTVSVTYTPSGTIENTIDSSSGTINNVTSIGTLPSHGLDSFSAGNLPSWQMNIDDELGTFDWSAGSLPSYTQGTFDRGTLPTTENATVVTNVSSITSQFRGTQTTLYPTFNGTQATITVS